jgi:hypothetical protein
MEKYGIRQLPKTVPHDMFVLKQSEVKTLKNYKQLNERWGYPQQLFECRSQEVGPLLQDYTNLLFRGLYNTLYLNYSILYDVFEMLERQEHPRHIPVTKTVAARKLLTDFCDSGVATRAMIELLATIGVAEDDHCLNIFKLAARQIWLILENNWEEAYVLGKWVFNN